MIQQTCDSNRLAAFLEGALTEEEVEVLTSHLDRCPTCATELEHRAAAPEFWDAAKEHLSGTAIHDVPNARPPRTENGMTFTARQIASMLNASDNPHAMGRLGKYEVIGIVGSGAMGVVLKAVDPTLDRVVALKVMNPTLASCGTARFRFTREAKAAAVVLHPNVIAIHGVSTNQELPFLAMPYVSGPSLQQRLNAQGPLELIEILRIGGQVAAGLAAAHQKGLIHRDIKPSNILLDAGVETALITDFGLARTVDDATMTRTGTIAGTPEYMSPEQAQGKTFDCASDVFSLGSLLYTLCTGDRPFRAKTTFGVLRKITDEEPKSIRDINPQIPAWLCSLIASMHLKDPAQRPTASQVRDQLESCLAHLHQPDRFTLPKQFVLEEPKRRHLFSRSFSLGVTLMTTTALGILIFASMASGLWDDSRLPDKSRSNSSEPIATRDQAVFRTLNLDFPNNSQSGTLIVDINRGFIEVEGHGEKQVVVEILTPPEFDETQESKNASEFVTLFTPKYDLDQNKDDNSIKLDTYNQDYALNLRIRVPFRTNLSLDTYRDGYIRVNNVTGTIHTHSEHCEITMLDIGGSATAYSRNGNLQVAFQEVADDARLDFESYNGNIDLSFPDTFAALAAISSGASNCRTAFAIERLDEGDMPEWMPERILSDLDEYQFGTINGGGVPLRIESEKGQITLRKNGGEKAKPNRVEKY